MRVLDCGCGPGSLTIGFAELVRPGDVLGIDIDQDMIERARTAAAEAKAENVRFEHGDVHNLSHADGSFDAVWAQLLLLHLPDPLVALKEMRRVLRPGGILGIRDADLACEYVMPETPLLREAMDLGLRVRQSMGGTPFYARNQRQLLLEAGFSRAEQTASIQSWGTSEAIRRLLPAAESRFRAYARTAVNEGWTDEAHVEEIIEEMRRWHERPDAFMCHADLSAIGYVDS
jgi:ubiquinone/menaquinone biosynthesis C-methylase UbiE